MPVYDLWGQSVNIEIPEEIFPDKEWRDEKDELFDHPEHGFFESTYQQKKLHYRRNLPKNNEKPKAIVIWQHGILGQSGFGMKCKSDGRYTDYALRTRIMNKAGFAVYAHDQLGHGFSEGERFYIPKGDWKINRDDLVAFARLVASQHEPGTPVFLGGDSYGGCLAIHAAKVLQDNPQDVTLAGILPNCPAIHGDLPPLPVIYTLRYGLAPFFPRWTPFFMPHPITADRCWKELEPRAYFTDQAEMRGLSQGGVPFCLGTALGLLLALQSVQTDVIPGVQVPFHINHGTEDHGVPITGSEFMVATAQTPKEDQVFNKIEGGYHGLFSELKAPEYLDSEVQFINKIISK